MKIRLKKFPARATTPQLARPGSAGFGLFSAEEKIPSRSVTRFKKKVGFAIPKSYFGKIHAYSIWVRRFTGVSGGVIDSDYRGNVAVIFFNCSHS